MIRSTFAIPLLIAVVSLIGLVAALAGDGLPDALSWVALGIPVLAVGWAKRTAGAVPARAGNND